MLCDNQFCLATMTLYFSAVWTQSGESGNTLNNQVQWYDRRESKHQCSAYNVRSRVQQPMFGKRHNALLLLSKPSAKTIQWSGSPRFWLTPPQKKSPGGISEAMRYGIVSPSGLRPRLNGYAAKARRLCRNAHYKSKLH